jgi:hypothetical protein
MRNDLAVLAGVMSVLAALPYIFDTLRGKTHPNIVTWFTWTLLNGINTAAAWTSGAVQTGIFTAAAGLATGAILIAGLRAGVKHYTVFDMLCQAAALGGIVLWKLTADPNLAVLINLAVDLAGLLPTYRHVLRAPDAETWQTFAITTLAGGLTLLSVQHYTFIAVAPPAYICFANVITVSTILLLRSKRRRQLLSPSKAP